MEGPTAAPFEGERPFVSVQITVNGNPMTIDAGLSIDGLLERLRVTREFTAVAVNREITPKSEYASVTLADGDRVEIVRPMGGG